MDRAGLILHLNANAETMVAMSEGAAGPFMRAAQNQRDAASALEADAQKEAALKALCDEPQHLGQPRRVVSPSKIRAIYGWSDER